jgi:hypothetical protein
VLGFGEAGVTPVNVTKAGAIESLVYETEVEEQFELVWPEIRALAKITVVAFAGTVAVIPEPAKAVADPLPSAELEHVLLE